MNLTIDIGNTGLTIGIFKGKKLIKRDNLATKSPDYYPFFKRFFNLYTLEKTIVSSVVPPATRKLEQTFRRLKIKNYYILGKNLSVPIKNRYQFPKQVGQDRLVNGFAAIKLYGSPAIIVDFGTAITFDAISRKNEYLGGLILPGMETSLSALAEKTALLPQVKLNPPKQLIGRNTRESMLSGAVFGFASLTDGVIRKLKKRLGPGCQAIATGGNVALIAPYCEELTAVDLNFTLKGLNLILSSR